MASPSIANYRTGHQARWKSDCDGSCLSRPYRVPVERENRGVDQSIDRPLQSGFGSGLQCGWLANPHRIMGSKGKALGWKQGQVAPEADRKRTRLNSSHEGI